MKIQKGLKILYVAEIVGKTRDLRPEKVPA